MTKNKYTNLLLQTLGCFISAAGIYSFAVAAEVPVTGIAGICAILYRLFGIPMGLSNVLINIPIILCTYKLLGRSFFIRSVYCMVLFAIFTDYLLPLMPVYQGDRLLATICGGVVGGIGDALIYMNNSSTGGLDFITMGIKARHPHLPFGNIMFAAALAVILLNGAVFQDVDSIIYGIMFNFIVSAVINKMMFGFSSSMLAMIVTDDGKAACAEIDRRYGAGTAALTLRDSYYNMKEKIAPCMFLIENAKKAMESVGVTPKIVPIRGGTDGARLSWDGLPCPNLSTGGYNYHGVREWIPADSLEAMTNVLVTLTESFAE